MVLTDNKLLTTEDFKYSIRKLKSGLTRIYRGSLLVSIGGFLSNNASTDDLFAGVSMDDIDLSATDNHTDGVKEINILGAQSNRTIELSMPNASIADIGKDVFLVDDGKVALVDTKNIRVGKIVDFINSNSVFVILN